MGVLKDSSNQIALRNFTVEDLSIRTPSRYGDPSSYSALSSLLAGEEGRAETSISTSKSSSRVESNFSEDVPRPDANPHPRRSQVRIDLPPEPTDRFETHKMSVDKTFSKENFGEKKFNFEENLSYEDGSLDGSQYVTYSDSDGISNGTNSTSYSAESSEDEMPSSVAMEVVIFFVVISTLVVLIFLFICWRRRRRRSEDEVPVFSRASTEHGNPTFERDQTDMEIAMNSDKPTNYKSFERNN